MMNFICKFCGSRNVKTIGGDNGDPFGRRPEKTVCCDCGRVLADEKDVFDTLYKEALKQTAEDSTEK